jgi:hypothetical protein
MAYCGARRRSSLHNYVRLYTGYFTFNHEYIESFGRARRSGRPNDQQATSYVNSFRNIGDCPGERSATGCSCFTKSTFNAIFATQQSVHPGIYTQHACSSLFFRNKSFGHGRMEHYC